MNFNTFLYGLIICFLLSFLLGVERQFRRRRIGLRTMILVSIGSYMFVSFSFMVTGYDIDISRIASQVVAGIGFLGAGVIIKDSAKNRVRGLTTAATLWCGSAIGVLCAGGFIYEAIAGSLIVLFSNIVLRYANLFINTKADNLITNETYEVIINSNNISNIMDYIINIDDKDIYFDNFKIDNNKIKFNMNTNKNNEQKIDKFINKLIYQFNIKKYEYKKINEEKIEEENDEL